MRAPWITVRGFSEIATDLCRWLTRASCASRQPARALLSALVRPSRLLPPPPPPPPKAARLLPRAPAPRRPVPSPLPVPPRPPVQPLVPLPPCSQVPPHLSALPPRRVLRPGPSPASAGPSPRRLRLSGPAWLLAVPLAASLTAPLTAPLASPLASPLILFSPGRLGPGNASRSAAVLYHCPCRRPHQAQGTRKSSASCLWAALMC